MPIGDVDLDKANFALNELPRDQALRIIRHLATTTQNHGTRNHVTENAQADAWLAICTVGQTIEMTGRCPNDQWQKAIELTKRWQERLSGQGCGPDARRDKNSSRSAIGTIRPPRVCCIGAGDVGWGRPTNSPGAARAPGIFRHGYCFESPAGAALLRRRQRLQRGPGAPRQARRAFVSHALAAGALRTP